MIGDDVEQINPCLLVDFFIKRAPKQNRINNLNKIMPTRHGNLNGQSHPGRS